MKTVGIYACIVIWFLHLLISGAGVAATALRLWPERSNPLISRMLIYIQASVLHALSVIVLLFIAKGVVFTWKFTITIFAFMFVSDCVRLPLILFVLRGPTPLAETLTNGGGLT